jgi:hypothetical protein
MLNLGRRPVRSRLSVYRIRWWNVAAAGLFVFGVMAFVLPLSYPSLRADFAGNVFSEIWGAILGAAATWVLIRRFRAERLDVANSAGFNQPFFELARIGSDLSESALQGPAALRTRLDAAMAARLRLLSTNAFRTASVFGRFLEVEQLSEMESAWSAALMLSEMDLALPDAVFMDRTLPCLDALLFAFLGTGQVSSHTDAAMAIHQRIVESRRDWRQRARSENTRGTQSFLVETPRPDRSSDQPAEHRL